MRRLPTELGQWFGFHAEAMDAALVYTMQQAGYDPATGQCARRPGRGPERLRQQRLQLTLQQRMSPAG